MSDDDIQQHLEAGQSPVAGLSPPTAGRRKRSQSLHKALVERIRILITEGDLAAGARISEVDLCERFGVSRTPLREALKVLSSEGLVEIQPNRGARVAAPTLEDLRGLFGVMGVLEGYSGELAATRMTDGDIARIEDLQAQMIEAFRAGDRHTYFYINQAIHDAILAAAGNEALTLAHRGVSGRILASRFNSHVSLDRWAAAVREHDTMLCLLQMRRPIELGQIMRAHIMNKFESIERDLKQAEETSRAPRHPGELIHE
ncbi:GntR family transcriptional regulator [Ancylobacter sp. MQZ15Z-1]|uniref:GntR family transcriptional regulator n=1 Tax=Ancylobacter mangrovi TaxID=2972472 RepID=A0A9X2PGZ2_9HYPH|nr:GntR family transcriptional regulator [Ancylobacter mangrovi]MCS0497224.1 GntR family transcriptional regulator [Ancylobacter mangrovi]